MTDDQAIAFDNWCRLALDVINLDEIDMWTAFDFRETLRLALAGGLTLSRAEREALDAADAYFDQHSEHVLRMLRHHGTLNRTPPEHYAREYEREHS